MMALTGLSQQLKAVVLRFGSNFFVVNACYFSVFSLGAFILSFPLDYYEGFVLEHRYRLSCQRFFSWFADVAKRGAIGFVVALVMVEAVYFFLFRFPGTWWGIAAFFWFLISVVLSRIFPKIILPLFFKSRPLEPGILRDEIDALLKKLDIRLKNVYVLDFSKKTVKANAMVAGLGSTKEIFLSDTLVADFPVKEVRAVLAHELGHYLHRDTFKLVALGLGCALATFFIADKVLNALIPRLGFSSISDIAGLPLFLVVLLALGLILLPAQNAFTRFLEKQADLFALRSTQDADSFISMMKRLGEKNLSDFTPSAFVEFFLYDHPSLQKRIDMALRLKGILGNVA
jgi:STE24 endopeptidase